MASLTDALRLSNSAHFAQFEFEHDLAQLSDEDMKRPRAIEWWYFDLEHEDLELIVMFVRKSPTYHRNKSSIFVEYRDRFRDFHRVSNYPADAFDAPRISDGAPKDGFEIRIAHNVVTVTGDNPSQPIYDIDFDVGDVSAKLHMVGNQRGFLPGADGCYLEHKTDASRKEFVSFSAPLARVSGSVTFKGESRQVIDGQGYHDHPWGTDMVLWSHREWHWGRMTSPDRKEDVMFARVFPSSDFKGGLQFLYVGDPDSRSPDSGDPWILQGADIDPGERADWRRLTCHGYKCPHSLTVRAATESGNREWAADVAKTLFDARNYNRASVRWRVLEDEPDSGGLASRAPGLPGYGWLEYVRLPERARWLIYVVARVVCFFWRKFPYYNT